MVVGRADLVGIDMRELCIHPDLRVADLVERSGHRAADTVSGQAFLIAHAFERTIERVLADALLQVAVVPEQVALGRSEEHTSELQSLMRISYAVFCLKK